MDPAAPLALKPHKKEVVPWNPFVAVLFVISIFFLSQIIALTVLQLFKTNLDGASVTAQFLFTLIAEVVAIGSVVAFVKSKGAKLSSIGLKRPQWRDVAYGLAAVLPYYILFILTVGLVSELVPGLDTNQEQQIGFDNVVGTPALIMVFISLAVLPPIAEEIMVRGFLYSSIKKALPLIPAVIITSLIFAAAHLPAGGPAGPLYIAALDTFVLSLVLIYLREKTGSLWASITLHAIKNSVAFFALFVFKTG